MAILPIIIAPDARLKVKCAPVGRVDAEIRALMDDMLESMHAAHGIGLAAPQVGVAKRVIVVDIAGKDEEPAPVRMANPQLLWASDETIANEEGCLSLPDHYAEVARPGKVRVRYIDHENEVRETEMEGLLATCTQHEMDHLDGVLFVDHLSALKRNIILRKLTKTKKLKEAEAV
ncbi:MAG: peptide deformylase [Rhodospirillales bacterium]|jgi:peptide deformylase|nr:peptide deformylase [Pseudomonadota bacterium]